MAIMEATSCKEQEKKFCKPCTKERINERQVEERKH